MTDYIQNLDATITHLEKTIEVLKSLRNDFKFQNIIQNINNPKPNPTVEIVDIINADTIAEINADTIADPEIWKDIEMYGINFSYQVSNHGRVKNKVTNHIMSQSLRDGYKSVTLQYRNNDKPDYKAIKIHRMVAFAFVPNNDPAIKTVVNHIDGNNQNNHYTNFEWVTLRDNNIHAINTGLTKITKRRVTQCDMDGIQIEIYESVDAAKNATNIDDGGIVKVCKGQRKSAGGFTWKYTDINPNEVELNEEDLEGFIQVKDFPNYLIDQAGRIYSKPYKKFLKTIATRERSEEIQLANNGVRKTYLLHNLMADHFLPKLEGKELVGHINGNKSDNRVSNLIRTTHSELCRMALNRKN
jgi:hypothetical protein